MNDFLDRKLSKRFRSFDYNGNGFIERSDFEISVARLAEEFGPIAVCHGFVIYVNLLCHF
ncbi:MAG: hypothetical protein ACSI46_08700 [Gloeotrichia echinulata DVL01]|jgi:hypothetical protein|nr:hypothetical protein [Gloeotrichia echinulata DEX184]